MRSKITLTHHDSHTVDTAYGCNPAAMLPRLGICPVPYGKTGSKTVRKKEQTQESFKPAIDLSRRIFTTHLVNIPNSYVLSLWFIKVPLFL